MFAARLKELTKGQIDITAHHAGSLGGKREHVEGLLQGAVQVATRGAAILGGWHKCVTSLYNVNNPQKRTDALTAALPNRLEITFLPDAEEQDAEDESDHESESENELDITIPPIVIWPTNEP